MAWLAWVIPGSVAGAVVLRGRQTSRGCVELVAVDDVWKPVWFTELHPVGFGECDELSYVRGTSARTSSDNSQKKFSSPAGLMISIIRAGTEPAFHMACISPRGLVM
jgi:hypothetical protein